MPTDSVTEEPDSRVATDALLRTLREDRWQPAGWGGFLWLASGRSLRQARLRPRALAEITILHGVFLLLGGANGRKWIVSSWLLASSHLGMLEQHRSIGWASAITLVRANLPAMAPGSWSAVVALATDLADGRLARRLRRESRFGTAADSLADAAFWVWFGRRNEPDAVLRVAMLLAWALPVGTVTATSIGRGRMVDAPRPAVLRPAAAMQAVLTARACYRVMRRSRISMRSVRWMNGRRSDA